MAGPNWNDMNMGQKFDQLKAQIENAAQIADHNLEARHIRQQMVDARLDRIEAEVKRIAQLLDQSRG